MNPVAVLLDTLQLDKELNPREVHSHWRALKTDGLSELLLEEGCILWLYRRLRSAGAEKAPESTFASWLSQRARDDAARNLLVDARVSQLSQWLTENEYAHVWIKGVARRVGNAKYPYADARTTNDVDLLLPHDRVTAAWAQLQRSGYAPACPPDLTPPNHFHLLPLCSTDGVAVELHRSTSMRVQPEEAWRRATASAETVKCEGLSFVIPSATELLWHAVTHGLHHGTVGFRLRYIQDASVILAGAAPIDWGVIVNRLATAEVPSRNQAMAWLGAAALFTRRELPPEASGMPPFELSRALRWRLAVHGRLAKFPRTVEKLVEEGTRAEIGWPVQGGLRGTSRAVRFRRRISALVARWVYRAWLMASEWRPPIRIRAARVT
jgi:hypothetical protein